MKLSLLILAALVVIVAPLVSRPSTDSTRYQPNWDSLDTRPLPPWYDEAKFGIFLHWGVFSVPSYGSAWFWYFWKVNKQKTYVDFMQKNYRPDFEYPDFAPQFRAEFYDPNEWAKIFESSGARYVVLVTKHHEGFCNWKTKVSWNWNSMDVGPHRDLTGELAAAIRNKTSLRFGVYHSLFEWFNPVYLQDKSQKFKTQRFVEDKTMPELYELVNNYKPDVIWSDGQWEANSTYWNSTNFLAWLYNDSPVKDDVVVNDRWGSDTNCKHGDFYNCHDRYNPGHVLKHKWENAMTLDLRAWTFRRNIKLDEVMTMKDLTKMMAETVSCGGNLLLNVGPTADGRIVPIFEERLRQIGSWLKVNGDAIYGTKPWTYQNDTITHGVWYTSKTVNGTRAVYAIVLDWPTDSLTLGAPKTTPQTVVTLLGVQTYTFKWVAKAGAQGINIMIPTIPANDMPCEWAWVFKFENLA